MSKFSVKTEAFDGPLDLLLHLIEKNEVDIFDIPIAPITEQYLKHIEVMSFSGMDSMSDFLLMAATLLYIKSKMLLPVFEPEAEADDPRADLVRRLVIYRQFREVSEELVEMEKRGVETLYKSRDESVNWDASDVNDREQQILGVVSAERLYEIFTNLLLRKERRTDKVRGSFGTVSREKFSVTEKIRQISKILTQSKKVSFSRLIDDCTDSEERITFFLALLELVRMNRANVMQDGLFADIICELRE